MIKTFDIYADAAELRVDVYPTMEALGDQPWGVSLYDLGDGLLLNEEAIFAEAGSAYDADIWSAAAERLLAWQKPETINE